MSRLIETIRFEHGKFHLLEYHQNRVNRAFSELFPNNAPLVLTEVLPEINSTGKCKCRIVYDDSAVQVTHAPYVPRRIASIGFSESNLSYHHKFEDRSVLESLVAEAQADEVIILKNGLVTDASYANLAFWDGKEWLTPANPLLQGVRRSYLIDQKKIHPKVIRKEDVTSYEKVSLINAMLDLGELEIDLS